MSTFIGIVLSWFKEKPMPKVVGIGGVFFRAADPAALAEWYEKHLGIDDLHTSVWRQEAGMTIFWPILQEHRIFRTDRATVDDQLPGR